MGIGFNEAAFTAGFNQSAMGVRESLKEEKRLKETKEAEASKLLAKADKDSFVLFKSINDSQTEWEEKIIQEPNYKKRNAMKQAYSSSQKSMIEDFSNQTAGTPYQEKYGNLYVPPTQDMLEKEVPFRAVIDGVNEEFVIPQGQYKTFTDMYANNPKAFTKTPDGGLSIRDSNPDKQGEFLDTSSGNYRRSQTQKVDAYDDAGNKVQAYDDQIEKKGLLRDKPVKQGYAKVWIDGRQVERKEETARSMVDKGEATYTKPDTDVAPTKKELNQQRANIAKLEAKKKRLESRGEDSDEIQIEIDAEKEKFGEAVGINQPIQTQKPVGASSILSTQLKSSKTNPKVVSSAINKMVENDYKGFKEELINMDLPEQAKAIGTGNQYAAKAWIETANDVIYNAQTNPSKGEAGFTIRPSQVLNQKKLEIQAMDINPEIQKNLLKDLEDDYKKNLVARLEDKDDNSLSGTLVESLWKSLPFGDTKATFSDYDERKISLQQIIEDKAAYNKEYEGGIKLDKDLLWLGRADRFENQTSTALEHIYEKFTGRKLDEAAMKSLLEEGLERSKFEFDAPFGGQEGRIIKGSELEQLLNAIFDKDRKKQKGK